MGLSEKRTEHSLRNCAVKGFISSVVFWTIKLIIGRDGFMIVSLQRHRFELLESLCTDNNITLYKKHKNFEIFVCKLQWTHLTDQKDIILDIVYITEIGV